MFLKVYKSIQVKSNIYTKICLLMHLTARRSSNGNAAYSTEFSQPKGIQSNLMKVPYLCKVKERRGLNPHF